MGHKHNHSNHLHPKADSHLDYVKKLDAEELLIKSDKTNATFDLDLSDWLDYSSLADSTLSVLVDKKAVVGTKKIRNKEFKHIGKQFKAFDEVTGFNIKFVNNINEADAGIVQFKNMARDIGREGPGIWDPGDSYGLGLQSVIYEQSKTVNKKLDKFDTKTTISHEIGHLLGLQHPITDFFDDHPNTIMGGDELVERDGPFLTKHDLDLIFAGWDAYWANPNIYG